MRQAVDKPRSTTARIVFDLLDPIPYGFFIGALIFDAVYARSAEVLWFKGAAWLISIGLLFAVVPRLIDLTRVWLRRGQKRSGGDLAGFWLYLLAVVAAIGNAFVHSRDAYGVMPEGLWLSIVTVILLMLAKTISALQWPEVQVAS